MKLLNNILKLNCLLLLLIVLEVKAEFRFPGDSYLFYTDSVDYATMSAHRTPNITVPGFLTDYQTPTRKKYANYLFNFELSDLNYSKNDSLFLVIKAMGGADKTLLNGKIIGETGIFPPHYFSSFDEERIYFIPNSLLKGQNQVKITLYSPDHSGGLFLDVPYIYSSKELKQISQNPDSVTAHPLIPFSNGIAAASYNPAIKGFTHFYPHIYAEYNEFSQTPIVLDKLIPEVYRDGIIMNTKTLLKNTGYVPGTGIIHMEGETPDLNISIFGFSPFTESHPVWVFYLLLEGQNLNNYSLDFTAVNPSNNTIVHKDAFTNAQQKWLRAIVHYKEPGSNFSSTKYKNLNSNFSILQRELKWWRNWQSETELPNDISREKMKLYLHSLVMIKMAQSREEFPAKGQIVSSLPPGNNRTNLLDQAIIIEGLLHSGHNQEALNCLQFLMRGKCGKHRNLTLFGNNLGLFNHYALSTHNYYANSVEKPINHEHPIISMAGFGLILANIRHYLENTEDHRFLEYYWEKVYREIALVLINLIDETGLVREDSGIKEYPLPGKHFTATSAMVYKGLVDAAWMARFLGQETAAKEFEFYANKIRINIQNKLFDKDNSIVRAALEGRTRDTYIDASITSLVNYIFTSQDEISNAVLKTMRHELKKNDSPLVFTTYEYDYLNREISTYHNLRYAECYYKMNENDKAEAILQKILDISRKNQYLLPEKLSNIFGTALGSNSIKAHATYLKTINTRN